VTPEVAQGLGMASARGALIAGVDDPGPAATAGIVAGDVILSFAGTEIDAVHTLPRLVAEESVDKEVPVVVLRDGMEKSLTVKLGRLDESRAAVAAVTPPPTTSPGTPTAPAPGTPGAPATPAPAPTLGVTGPLGLTLSDLSPTVRDRLGISTIVTRGVAVVAVAQGSIAAEKRLAAGDVIIQVDQENVATPDDVAKKFDALKKAGRTTAQLVVQNKDGNVRFVNMTIQ
jgi:serine protease Do